MAERQYAERGLRVSLLGEVLKGRRLHNICNHIEMSELGQFLCPRRGIQ